MAGDTPTVDEAAEHVYGLPLEEFVVVRDALAREARAAGRRDDAAAIKRLRKPSVAAWALDRVARDDPQSVQELLDAAARLRRAHGDALSGDASDLRDATRAVSREVDRVADAAGAVLEAERGRAPGAQRDAIVSTLRAVTVDEDAADLLRRGVLVDELAAPGLGLDALDDGAVPAQPARPPAREAKPRLDEHEAARRAARDRAGRANREARVAADRSRRLADAADRADDEARRAREEADAADAESRRLEDEAAEAERELARFERETPG